MSAAQDTPALTDAARDVLAERGRQTGIEGYHHEHDDEHWDGEMLRAAVCYAWPVYPNQYGATREQSVHDAPTWAPLLWPWDQEDWKPKGKRRNLVRAAALLIAEVERLDRAAIAKAEGSAS